MRETLEKTRLRGGERESTFGHFDEPDFFERDEDALRGVTSRSKYISFEICIHRLLGDFLGVTVEGFVDVLVGIERVYD